MKKIFLISAIIVSAIGISNAQSANTAAQPQTPEARAKAQVAKMNTTANLVGDQVTKVNKIYIDYFKALDALETKKATMDAKAYDKEVSDITSKRNAAFAGVLTADQKKLLQEKKKQKDMKSVAPAPKN